MISLFYIGTAKAVSVDLPSLTVLADRSLAVPMAEIARVYSAKYKTTVNVSYLSPKEQAERVEEGDAADVAVTGHSLWLQELKNQGLIDVYNQQPVARGQLVLVADAKSPLQLKIIPNMPLGEILKSLNPNARFAIGDPEYMVEGLYAAQAMDKLNIRKGLEPITFKFRSMNQIRNLIMEQQAVGILYKTDADHSPGIKVIDILPIEAAPPILFQAVVIAGENMQTARNFVQYLETAEARKYFIDYGFKSAVTP